jgi:secreted trypsin-like serine protease
VLWVLGVGAVGPTLAQGGPVRAGGGFAPGPVATASIVDGSAASIAELPFQVALYDPRAGSPAKGFFCGGVILDATRVATAAHCLFNERGRHSPTTEIEVLAGSTFLEPADPGSVRDPVAAATVDPAYNPATSDYDVGVLRLARPLWSGPAPALDGHTTIAPLAPDAALAAAHAAVAAATTSTNQTATTPPQAIVSGWGDLNPLPSGSPSYPLRLRKTHVSLVATTLCEEAYSLIEQPITARMMCAGGAPVETGMLVEGERLPAAAEGQGHADSCYGDSGGPLVAPGLADSSSPAGEVLLGLVDFGNGCGQAGYPGVYLRVADPAVSRFLGAGPPLASAGGIHRGVCPNVSRIGHRAAGRGHTVGGRAAHRFRSHSHRHSHSRRPAHRARRCKR